MMPMLSLLLLLLDLILLVLGRDLLIEAPGCEVAATQHRELPVQLQIPEPHRATQATQVHCLLQLLLLLVLQLLQGLCTLDTGLRG